MALKRLALLAGVVLALVPTAVSASCVSPPDVTSGDYPWHWGDVIRTTPLPEAGVIRAQRCRTIVLARSIWITTRSP